MSFSLYIHIPFCKKKCAYCDFPSYPGKEALIDDYLDALKAESGYCSSLYGKPKVNTIFIGGGTPTLLSPKQIEQLFEMINGDFIVDDHAEITCEANPGTVTMPKLRALYNASVNRISLGAQSFSNNLLKKLGRIHLAHEIEDAFEMIRDAGFNNINLDLIFALPGESFKDWAATLDKAIKLGPEHLSIYNLQLEEGTPLYAEKLEGGLMVPDEDEELRMYQHAISELGSHGYQQYEISNFAKKGFECRHNISYWTMKDYIGLGAGAHSFIGGTRIENTPDLEKYLSRDISKIKSEHKNTRKENMAETAFLGLRLMEGFNLGDFTNKFGISFREIYQKEIRELTSDGLLEITGHNAKLTGKGLYVANEVFKAFI